MMPNCLVIDGLNDPSGLSMYYAMQANPPAQSKPLVVLIFCNNLQSIKSLLLRLQPGVIKVTPATGLTKKMTGFILCFTKPAQQWKN
jgi:hypothetical protein